MDISSSIHSSLSSSCIVEYADRITDVLPVVDSDTSDPETMLQMTPSHTSLSFSHTQNQQSAHPTSDMLFDSENQQLSDLSAVQSDPPAISDSLQSNSGEDSHPSDVEAYRWQTD